MLEAKGANKTNQISGFSGGFGRPSASPFEQPEAESEPKADKKSVPDSLTAKSMVKPTVHENDRSDGCTLAQAEYENFSEKSQVQISEFSGGFGRPSASPFEQPEAESEPKADKKPVNTRSTPYTGTLFINSATTTVAQKQLDAHEKDKQPSLIKNSNHISILPSVAQPEQKIVEKCNMSDSDKKSFVRENRSFGRPSISPFESSSVTKSAPEAASEDKDPWREEDTGFGRPQTQPIADGKTYDNLQPYPIDNQKYDFDFTQEETLASSFFLPNILRKYLRLILFLISSVMAFFLITQTAAFLANLRQLSLIEIIALALPLMLFGGVIVYVLFRMIYLVCKLKLSPQIKIKALQELEARSHLRNLSLQKKREAVDKLIDYLKNDFVINRNLLKSFKISPETINQLEKSRQRLISQETVQRSSTEDYLMEFKRDILNVLDEIAQGRIKRYSANVAIMTGASPFAIIDRLIMLSSSLAMLKELLEIYSLKPGWDKSLALMAQFIANTYCAGLIESVAENATEKIFDYAGEVLEQQVPNILKSFAGKVAEGAIQGVLIYRLGNSAIKVLHPIK